MHAYEIRPRSDKRGFDLISDALPFGGLWYAEPNAISNAIHYAKFYSRSHDAVIRACDEAGDAIETHEHTGDFKEWRAPCSHRITHAIKQLCRLLLPPLLLKRTCIISISAAFAVKTDLHDLDFIEQSQGRH